MKYLSSGLRVCLAMAFFGLLLMAEKALQTNAREESR